MGRIVLMVLGGGDFLGGVGVSLVLVVAGDGVGCFLGLDLGAGVDVDVGVALDAFAGTEGEGLGDSALVQFGVGASGSSGVAGIGSLSVVRFVNPGLLRHLLDWSGWLMNMNLFINPLLVIHNILLFLVMMLRSNLNLLLFIIVGSSSFSINHNLLGCNCFSDVPIPLIHNDCGLDGLSNLWGLEMMGLNTEPFEF